MIPSTASIKTPVAVSHVSLSPLSTMKGSSWRYLLFCSASIVFVMNVVGYFSPSWFLMEEMADKGSTSKKFHFDGRRFSLPHWIMTEDSDISMPEPSMPASIGPNMQGGNPASGDRPVETSSAQKIDSSLGRKRRAINMPTLVTDVDGGPPNPSNAPKLPRLPAPTPNQTKNTGNEVSDEVLVTISRNPVNLARPDINQTPKLIISNGSVSSTQKSGKNINMPILSPGNSPGASAMRRNNQKLYLSAGLWYGRMCIHSFDENERKSTGIAYINEWCTHYIRNNETGFDRNTKLTEIRIEATVAVVFSAVALVTSSSSCLSQRHLLIRVSMTVLSLLVSASVMTVPVVWIIKFHAMKERLIMRHREWRHFPTSLHQNHDLFDHWSVVLCGFACIIGFVTVLVAAFVSIRKRHSIKRISLYSLDHRVENETKEPRKKLELRGKWIYTVDKPSMTSAPAITSLDCTDEDSMTGIPDIKIDDVSSGDALSSFSAQDGGADSLDGDPTTEEDME